uniref:Uncharacterized protein n=1 Tax=viral metagenome TaxID=1070528 RepID=A0A6M3JG36_9ZZZZ
MPSEYRPRLSVDITEEQRRKLDRYLDYGMRKMLFGVVIDDLLHLFEEHGVGPILGLFVERSISLREICKLNTEG